MAKSSIHFEKTDASFAKKHNSRADEPTYLLPKKFWQGNTFEEIYTSKNLDVMYRWQCRLRSRKHRRGSTPTLKNSLTEAVINLNSNHTLEDVKRVAQAIQEQYKFTPVSYAIHRDEGHMESRNGKTYPVYNYHAHVVFFTMAEGESQRRKLGSKELEDINTLTAKLLGMERGESKTQRWQRVADLLGVEVEQLWREEGESATDYKDRMRIFAAERGVEDFDIYKAVKPKKRLSAKQYREFAERMEKQKILTEKEVEERFKEDLEKDQKTISKLTKDNTVLSNNNNAKAQTLIEIATELEVTKNEQGKFTLDDIKEKVKALNSENKLRKKDISTVCETVRKASIGTGVPKEFYRELGAIKKSDVKEVQELQQALIDLLEKYEDKISDLEEKNTVLSNQPPKEIVKTVEVVKEVKKNLSIEEIEELPRVIQLKNEIQSLKDFYSVKPSDFSFRVSADDLKTKKFGFFNEETAQGTADRINLEIRRQISPIIQSNKALSKENNDLTDKVKDLEGKNNFLSKRVNAMTDELKELYQTLCLPFKDTIKERLNIFKGWINDFLFGNEEDIDDMRDKIINNAPKTKQNQVQEQPPNNEQENCDTATITKLSKSRSFYR